jgi:hypothetical protein
VRNSAHTLPAGILTYLIPLNSISFFMKKTILFLVLLASALFANAAQRSAQEALAVARTFFAQGQVSTRTTTDDLRLVASSADLLGTTNTTTRSTTAGVAFYVYNYGDAGYVIVSGDDRMKPVLGYSFAGAFVTENLPDNLRFWLQLYDKAYEQVTTRKKSNVLKVPATPAQAASYPSTVAPLLGGINYNQDAPYWNDCPIIGGERTYAGCVATAMAMIMRYHQYPTQGIGSHSYQHSSGTLSFDYENTPFDWANMLPDYNGQYNATQAKAVSTLLYACGVAVDMNYGTGGSGAQSSAVPQAAIDYFGYDANMAFASRDYFTSTEWMDKIKNELSSGRPIYYSGASLDVGHAFVFDGYDAADMVHVNWGWGGSNNGYFEVFELDPDNPGIGGGSSAGGGYRYEQTMITGWQKPTETTAYTSLFSVDSLVAAKVEVVKAETFGVTAYTMINRTTKFSGGEVGLIAEQNGVQQVLTTRSLSEVPTYWGYSQYSFSLAIPATLADGVYTIYLATKDKRETAWSYARGIQGNQAWITLTVAGDKCTLERYYGAFSVDLLSGTAEATQALYSGRKGNFKVTIANGNPTHDFYNLAGIAFISVPTETAAADFVGLVGYTQVEVKPGATKELLLSGDLKANLLGANLDIAAGDYYICPGIQFGQYVYALLDEDESKWTKVTVKRALGSPTLVVSNGRLEKSTIGTDEQLNVMADLSLTGFGNVYIGSLMAAVFKSTSGSTNNLHFTDVIVESGAPTTLNMRFNPGEPAGDYFVEVYGHDATGNYNKYFFSLPFTITVPTAIGETQASEGIRLYREAQSIRLVSDEEIEQVRIYALDGRMIYSATPSSPTVSIPCSDWMRGIYLIEAKSARGVWKKKFVR